MQQAHTAAVDGDVITLSAGSFTAVNFTKRITVRGAGMGTKLNDTDDVVESTKIVGDFSVSANADSAHVFTLEGINHEETMRLFKVSRAQFVKCKLYDVETTYSSSISENNLKDYTLFQCYVSHLFKVTDVPASFNIMNSYIKFVNFNCGSTRFASFTNCVFGVYGGNTSYCVSNLNSQFSVRNSIIIYLTDKTYAYTPSTNIYNTLWIGATKNDTNPFTGSSTADHNNSYVLSDSTIFEPNTFYRLAEGGKKYKGIDGKEIGIYGGNLPFDPMPTNPRITKFNVAPKTDAEGKLSVDIEVVQP